MTPAQRAALVAIDSAVVALVEAARVLRASLADAEPPAPVPVDPPVEPPAPADPPADPPAPVDPPTEPPQPPVHPLSSEVWQIREGGSAADVGMTRDSFYSSVQPWRQRGGDWLDANGVMWGAAPLSQAPAVAGQWCVLDVSPLIEPGRPVQIVVRNLRGQAARHVHGRRGVNPPVLMLADGSVVQCAASAVSSIATAVSANATPTFALQDGTTLFLRFPPVTGPAVLRIWVERAFGGNADLGVFRLAEPVPPLAADTSRATLEDEPGLYYRTDSFEGPEWAWLKDDRYANRFGQYDWVDDPLYGRSLRIWMDPRQGQVFEGAVPIPESDEVAFEYDLFHLSTPTDHPLRDSGKMPGFRSATKPDDRVAMANSPLWSRLPPGTLGSLIAGNGGAKVHGNDGWSLRGAHGIPYPPGHPLEGSIYMGQYAYHADMLGLYGDSWGWTQAYPQGAPLGKWVRVYQRLRVNTPGVRDGILECRMDGRLVFRKTDLYLRSAAPWHQLAALGVQTQGGCRSVWLNLWHGGTSMPTKRAPFVLLRNLKVQVLA